MAYTPDVFNVGDIVRAAWANKVEQQLAKQGNYMGVVASESDLPTEASLGDWYFVQDKGYIVYYDGSNWKRQKVEWNEVLNKPIKFVNSFSDLPTSPSEGEAYYIYNADTVVTYRNGAWQLPQTGEYIPRGAIAYFTTSLIDKVNYITPEGFENSTVTDYGLYTTSDGSLVVTKRYDDKPFDGVHAFAVEEGTENLFTDDDAGFYTSIGGWRNIDYSVFEWANETNPLTGQSGVLKVGGTYHNAYFKHDSLHSFSHGTWTQTIWYKRISGSKEPERSAGVVWYTDGTYDDFTWDGGSVIKEELANGIVRLSTTFTTDNTKTIDRYEPRVAFFSDSDSIVYILGAQLEQKPFATSFVDGSRPNGGLLLFDDATVRSWADNGIVIAGWWKFNYWSEDRDFRVFSCTESGGFNIEKFPDYDIRLVINDGGAYLRGYFQDPDVFADLDWHFVVFYYRPDTKTAKVYVDAVEQTSVTLSQGLYFDEDKYYSLAIGAELNGGTNPPTVGSQASILVANLFIGKVKDSSGNLIWTDDYIKKIYMLQRPWIIGG